jgi:putative nucleotidyltransferase with HDIG domain
MSDLRETNRREVQLDAISGVLIVSMLAVVSLLLYFLSAKGVKLPETVPLAGFVPQILLGGFIILVLLYLTDQRRRLRAEVSQAVAETEAARAELDETVSWLRFSHEAASRLGSEGVAGGLKAVLAEAAELFQADAAAVLGEDEEYTFIAPDAPVAEAERALTHVALVAAGQAAPLHIQSLGTEAGQAIAVPLRVAGDLRYIMCIWRREREFEAEQLDALGLMGRMVELAIEREESLAEAQAQLEGTLRVLQYLVADKRPDYSRHAVGVADLAAAIGQKLGLRPSTRKDLRLAGLIHDVGMMSLPRDVADARRPLTAEEMLLVRQHSRIGAEIAKAANFDPAVQDAVAGHHERTDGSGYPLGARGNEIPLEARILAVCEVFDSMTHRSYHGGESGLKAALAELTDNSGTLYDRTVVSALLEVVKVDAAEVAEDAPQATTIDFPAEQFGLAHTPAL